MSKITVYQRNNLIYNLTLTDEEGKLVNITNVDIAFSVVRNIGDTDKLIYKTSTDISEIEKIFPLSGNFCVYLDSDDTDLDANYYYYNIEVLFANQELHTIEQDFFIVMQDVT